MIIIVASVVGTLFLGCIIGVVVLEKPWVRVAMLLVFGIIAFLFFSAYHGAELGKQRAMLMHQFELQKGMTNQAVANNELQLTK